jgi:hypothetical protein
MEDGKAEGNTDAVLPALLISNIVLRQQLVADDYQLHQAS